jgi:quercetin dioxygenase-like cupin family protein
MQPRKPLSPQAGPEIRQSPVRNLAAIGAETLRSAASAPARRAALTLVGGATAPLRQTVLALSAGVRLAEHEAPGTATLQVLHGSVRLTAGEESWDLGEGDHVEIPASRHQLEALEDAAVLLTVATGAAPG